MQLAQLEVLPQKSHLSVCQCFGIAKAPIFDALNVAKVLKNCLCVLEILIYLIEITQSDLSPRHERLKGFVFL